VVLVSPELISTENKMNRVLLTWRYCRHALTAAKPMTAKAPRGSGWTVSPPVQEEKFAAA
jgi:hypothetical protein